MDKKKVEKLIAKSNLKDLNGMGSSEEIAEILKEFAGDISESPESIKSQISLNYMKSFNRLLHSDDKINLNIALEDLKCLMDVIETIVQSNDTISIKKEKLAFEEERLGKLLSYLCDVICDYTRFCEKCLEEEPEEFVNCAGAFLESLGEETECEIDLERYFSSEISFYRYLYSFVKSAVDQDDKNLLAYLSMWVGSTLAVRSDIVRTHYLN